MRPENTTIEIEVMVVITAITTEIPIDLTSRKETEATGTELFKEIVTDARSIAAITTTTITAIEAIEGPTQTLTSMPP